jgi:hypothetical protein
VVVVEETESVRYATTAIGEEPIRIHAMERERRERENKRERKGKTQKILLYQNRRNYDE